MSRHIARVALVLLAGVLPLLTGCGAGGSATTASVESASPPEPEVASDPLTLQERRVAQGARLAVSDGCTACHLNGGRRTVGPDFASFAGHRVALVDGRRVIVDAHFLTQGLVHPANNVVRGYLAGPMLDAMRRLRLEDNPAQIAALVAFIQQIGPETP